MTAHIEQFRRAMERSGITPPDLIVDDGALHRWGTNGKSHDDAGWYVLHSDGIPAGAFGDFRAGVFETFRADIGRELTREEQREQRERLEAIRRQRDAEDAKRHAEAAARAHAIWKAAKPAPADHPYLTRKGVKAHGLRIYRGELVIRDMPCDGALVVPLHNSAGELQTVEFIGADGQKRFRPGGRKSGAYYALGKPGRTIVVCEGFATGASVHEATGYAVAVAIDAGNLGQVAKVMREKFPQGKIIIAADNDESGTGQRAAEEAARAVGALVAIPADPGADWNDIHARSGLEAVKAGIEAARELTEPTKCSFVSFVSAQEGHSQSFRALPNPLPEVPKFDLGLLPDAVRPWVEDHADALQCPPEYVGVGAMVALAGTIGRQVAIQVKQRERWIERCVLWGCIVGRPSAGKSPALRPAYGILTRLEAAAWDDYQNALREYEAKVMIAAAAKDNAKKIARKKLEQGDKLGALEAAEAAIQVEEEPQQARLVVNDVTIEKLGEVLNANPRGLVQFRDELSGLLASLDREGREGDRAFWLECWSGSGPYVVDRIGRGTIRVGACAVSILGGTQPGKLAEYVRAACRGGSGDDGLLPRFQLMVYPDAPTEWRYEDRAPNQAALEECWRVLQRLNAMDVSTLGAERSDFIDVPYLRFAPEAQELFAEWQTALMMRLRAGNEAPFIESHLGKYPALAARLALAIHLADGGSGPVAAEALGKALDWTAYLEGHARRIYAPVTDNGLTAAHALLGKRAELTGPFTLREVQRKEWAGLDRGAIEGALEWLTEYGYLDAGTEETGGRPTTRYQWRAAP